MSKIKFVKVSSFYPEGIAQLYATRPQLKNASYEEQYRAMMDQGIGWADFWVINLNRSEEFEATLFIINNEFAQKKWASENQFKYTEENWQSEIIIEQVRRATPEIFFANDYVFLKKELVSIIKKSVSSIKLTLGWDGIGFCDPNKYTSCDVVISCGKQFVDFYNANGTKSVLFQFGFEQTILGKITLNKPLYDVSFAGSLTLRNGGHHSRLKLLGAVAKNVDVDYWLSSFDTSKPYLIKNILKKIKSTQFSDVEDIIRLWRINKGSVYGLEMYQILASSKITLNSHIDTADHIAGNIRLWEATGVGACLVTDWKENLPDIFIPDEEVVVYKSPDEAVEKVKYLLEHPEKCAAIAKAGQKRTLEQYSYQKRMQDFIPILKGLLN